MFLSFSEELKKLVFLVLGEMLREREIESDIKIALFHLVKRSDLNVRVSVFLMDRHAFSSNKLDGLRRDKLIDTNRDSSSIKMLENYRVSSQGINERDLMRVNKVISLHSSETSVCNLLEMNVYVTIRMASCFITLLFEVKNSILRETRFNLDIEAFFNSLR